MKRHIVGAGISGGLRWVGGVWLGEMIEGNGTVRV